MTSADDGYCTCDGDDPRINASCGIAAHRADARKVLVSAGTQALIEEAREVWAPHNASAFSMQCPGCAVRRLADALEASEAARRDLTDKIEALAARWERLHDDVPPETVEQDGYDDALHDLRGRSARSRLR